MELRFMQEDVEFRHLRYFVAVAKERSFSRAARRAFVTQPAISMGIRELENFLHTPLFRRHPRRAQLTDAGLRLLDYAQAVLELHTETMQEIRVKHGHKSNPLRLGIAPFVDPRLVETARCTFRELFPACGLEPACGPTAQLLDDLTAGRIDAALITLPHADRTLASLEIAKVRMVVCLRKSDPLAAQKSIAPQQLNTQLTVFRHPDHHPAAHEKLGQMLREAGVDAQIQARATSPEEIIVLVRAGIGCALVREQMELPSDLTTRPLEGLDWTVDSALIYSPAHKQNAIPLWAERLKQAFLRSSPLLFHPCPDTS